MNKAFGIGMILGLGVGALLVANSVKARSFIKTKQQDAIDEVKKMTSKSTKTSKVLERIADTNTAKNAGTSAKN